MIPIRFGAANRQLFGLYQAANSDATRDECALLCNPFGQEAIRSHRLFKVLADRLCRDGFHVLRFDYFGTGDSAGNDDELSLSGLIDDLLAADNELQQRSACRIRAWVGLRLGASVAALASANAAVAPQRLVLWEPITNGTDYLAELAQAHSLALEDAYGSRCAFDLALREQFAREAGTEALGFPLPDSFRAELKSLSEDSFANVKSTAIDIFSNAVSSGKIAADVEWVKKLATRGVEIFNESIAEPIVWTADEMMNAATVPGEVLQRISARFEKKSAPDLISVQP